MNTVRGLVLLAATLCSGISSAAAPNPETITEVSQASARTTIEHAVRAMGGAPALQSLGSIRFRMSGEIWDRLQMTTVTPPFEGGTQQVSVLMDLRNDRLRIDEQFRVPARDSHATYAASA